MTPLSDVKHKSWGPLITSSNLIYLISFLNCLHPWRSNPWNSKDNSQAGSIVRARPTARQLPVPGLHQLTHQGKLQVQTFG